MASSVSVLVGHESCRHQGHPIISALSGSAGVGISCWRTWCQTSGRAAVVSWDVDPAKWSDDFLKGFLHHCDPSNAARQFVAQRSPRSRSAAELTRLTLPQLRRFFEQAAVGESGADRLCRRILEAEIKNESVTPDRVSAWFRGNSDDKTWLDIFGAIIDFLPAGQTPALLVVPMAARSSDVSNLKTAVALLEKAAQQLAVLISRVPAASLGLCAEESVFELYLKTAPECYSKAVLRESLTRVSGLTAAEIAEKLTRRLGRPISEWDRQIAHLADQGASPELVEQFIEVVCGFDHAGKLDRLAPSELSTESPSTENTVSVEETDPARSAAERFLYALLESTPDLAGLFELNGKPGFDFGGRPAEIDLACRSKLIAIEIDGCHHFTDQAAYRRDRRKDVLLQEQGFFVLRFLAEDVVSEMELICETIRGVVQLRE